jgi:hypothetical protein
MEFEKSSTFKLPRIGVNAEALRAIETVLTESGTCVYRYYQDACDSLDALLARRGLPLDRIDLDAPAATVCIDRSGVTVHHLPEAHDIVRELQAAILKHEITSLARMANFYELVLAAVLLGAWLRDSYSILILTWILGTLLHHVASPLEVKKPLIKLPFGMQINQHLWVVAVIVALVLVMVTKTYLQQGK